MAKAIACHPFSSLIKAPKDCIIVTNSGKVLLDENHNIFEVSTVNAFALPLNLPSFLELNYKGDNEFSVGVYVTTSTDIIKSSLLSVRPSSIWKKIYVNISALGGVVPGGIDYKIYLRAEKDPSLSEANIYFDNLKVVY